MKRQFYFRLAAALSAVVLITGGVYFSRSHVSASPDFVALTSTQEISIEIPQGATGSDIAQLLAQAGVVKSFSAFFKVAVSDSRSAQVAPGVHR